MTDTRESDPTAAPVAALAFDADDERLIRVVSPGDYLRQVWSRVRGGELGMMPVVVGLLIICTVFYAYEPSFLSSRSLVSIMLFAAPVGIIALGIVVVLLLGEIDLSVGSVSGFGASVMAVLFVDQGRSLWVAIGAAILVGVAIGAFYAALFVWVGVPSFVFSLAGLLAFEGALLWMLSDGSINISRESGIAEFTRDRFLTDVQAYVLVAVITLVYLVSRLWSVRQRRAAGLTPPNLLGIILKTAALGGGLGWLTYYLGIARGWGYLFVLFAALVVVMDLLLRLLALGPAPVRRRRQRGGRTALRHQGRPGLLLGVRDLLDVRCGRRHPHRGPADLGLADERHRRDQPDRHRSRGDRWHQPLRGPWVRLRRAARDPGAAGDRVRAEPDERRLGRPLHRDWRSAPARCGHRLRSASGPLQQRQGIGARPHAGAGRGNPVAGTGRAWQVGSSVSG